MKKMNDFETAVTRACESGIEKFMNLAGLGEQKIYPLDTRWGRILREYAQIIWTPMVYESGSERRAYIYEIYPLIRSIKGIRENLDDYHTEEARRDAVKTLKMWAGQVNTRIEEIFANVDGICAAFDVQEVDVREIFLEGAEKFWSENAANEKLKTEVNESLAMMYMYDRYDI